MCVGILCCGHPITEYCGAEQSKGVQLAIRFAMPAITFREYCHTASCVLQDTSGVSFFVSNCKK